MALVDLKLLEGDGFELPALIRRELLTQAFLDTTDASIIALLPAIRSPASLWGSR